MQRERPDIEVRAIGVEDARALHRLDYSFETDRIYTLKVEDRLIHPSREAIEDAPAGRPVLTFALHETPVDPPFYKNFNEDAHTLREAETRLRQGDGGYLALADDEVAGGVLLSVEQWREVARIEDLIVGRQFRRYGIGSLLLNCAADWARKQGCWALLLETQTTNYPAIQFYLRNGLEVWGIHQHFYPPGPVEHEVAIIMGKRLTIA
jgi:GNAT superfamily N-acetyltransferase